MASMYPFIKLVSIFKKPKVLYIPLVQSSYMEKIITYIGRTATFIGKVIVISITLFVTFVAALLTAFFVVW